MVIDAWSAALASAVVRNRRGTGEQRHCTRTSLPWGVHANDFSIWLHPEMWFKLSPAVHSQVFCSRV